MASSYGFKATQASGFTIAPALLVNRLKWSIGSTSLERIHQGLRGGTDTHCTLGIEAISIHSPVMVHFHSSSNRVYSLLSATNLAEPKWTEVPSQTAVPGTGGLDALSDTTSAPGKFYKVGVSVP